MRCRSCVSRLGEDTKQSQWYTDFKKKILLFIVFSTSIVGAHKSITRVLGLVHFLHICILHSH